MPSEKELKKLVREKYAGIAAASQEGCGCCSNEPEYINIGESYTTIEGYVPESDLGLGCGLPTQSVGISPGDTVVDLGSGAGNDVFIARRLTGEKGRVIGIDMTEEMVQKARANNRKLGFTNVEFKTGDIEAIPLPDRIADVVISNCVINLAPDKACVFAEIHRILKNGGHFCVSDIVTRGNIPEPIRRSAEMYAGCVAGAVDEQTYLDLIHQAGFSSAYVNSIRRIELPEALLDKFLSPPEINNEYGIYSITVSGTK